MHTNAHKWKQMNSNATDLKTNSLLHLGALDSIWVHLGALDSIWVHLCALKTLIYFFLKKNKTTKGAKRSSVITPMISVSVMSNPI